MNDLVFHPVLPWPLLIAAAGVTLALLGWSLWVGLQSKGRLACLAFLRLLTLAGVLLMLTQAQAQRQEVTILRPQVAVVVDDSASMNDPVDDAQPRRAARVKEFLESPAVRTARDSFDFRLYNLDQKELSADQAPAGFNANASNIVNGVGQVVDQFKGQPLAAVLVLTDGLDTSGVARPETASFNVPVDTFELEKPFRPKPHEQRISIAGADFPPRVVVGWRSEIHLSIAGKGMSGKAVPVELWRAGRKIAEATTAFNEDEQTRQVTFEYTHRQAGVDQFEARVHDAAADREAQAYPFSIAVMEPGKRVLYVQDQLSFDYKFLRKAIVSNRNLQLASFTRWSDGRIVNLDERNGAAPAIDFSPRGLASDAVVILGDLAPDALPTESWKNLRDFVDAGGGLILLGGPASYPSARMAQTPLAELLPIKPPAEYREGSFSVRITEAGLHHPVFGPVFAQVKDFPTLTTANIGGTLAPSAETLMETVVNGQATPLVAAVRFGKGRVVSVMSDSVWRWRLAAAQWRMDQSPYELFWAQLLDWMAPKEDSRRDSNSVELFTERPSYLLGEKPEVRAVVQTTGSAPPATLRLQVHTPNDKTLEYTMRPEVFQSPDGKSVHGYAATVEPNVAGIFPARTSVTLGGGKVDAETRFVVNRPATEMTGKPINRDFLQKLAAASKGRYYPIGEWDHWTRDLHVEEQHTTRENLTDLWNTPVLLGFIMCLLTAEWMTRKMWHLP